MTLVPWREYNIQNKQPRSQTFPKDFLGPFEDSKNPPLSFTDILHVPKAFDKNSLLVHLTSWNGEVPETVNLKRKSGSYSLLSTLTRPFVVFTSSSTAALRDGGTVFSWRISSVRGSETAQGVQDCKGNQLGHENRDLSVFDPKSWGSTACGHRHWNIADLPEKFTLLKNSTPVFSGTNNQNFSFLF